MKSRTSFSKFTGLKKDLLRFAPVWALYLIGMMLVLFEVGNYGTPDSFAYRNLSGYVMAFGVVNLIYAAICAMTLFSDLYNTRMCYSLHALPLRRESWFLSHLAAGLAFSLVPNTLASLVLMTKLGDMWFLALYWLLAVTLQFLFFFGIATVSALLTGNRFALLAVYSIFNFVAMLLYGVLVVVYVPMLYGVVAQLDDFSLFSPVVRIFSCKFFEFERYSTVVLGQTQTCYRFVGLSDGWGYLAVLGVVGMSAIGAALLLYRKRNLESAGDFVAFRKMKVPVCLVLTLCVTQLFALMGEATGNMVIWVSVGAIIGFFGSMMLLERRIKVFRKKTFLGFGALVLALIVSFSAVQFDWFGIADWTPRAEQVKSVTIANYRMSGNSYSYEDYYSGNRVQLTLTEQEQIGDIIEAHEDILERRNESDQPTHAVYIYYTLTDGRTVARYYRAPASGKNYTIFSNYFYTTKQILGYQDWDAFLEGIQYMNFDLGDIPKELYKKVMEALRVDCAKGNITLGFPENPSCFLEYHAVEQNGRVVHRTLYLPGKATEITRILQSPEVVLGYTDWQTYLNSIVSIELNGEELKQAQYEGLLDALRQDCEDGCVTLDGNSATVWIVFTVGDETYNRCITLNNQMEATRQWLKNME